MRLVLSLRPDGSGEAGDEPAARSIFHSLKQMGQCSRLLILDIFFPRSDVRFALKMLWLAPAHVRRPGSPRPGGGCVSGPFADPREPNISHIFQ